MTLNLMLKEIENVARNRNRNRNKRYIYRDS